MVPIELGLSFSQFGEPGKVVSLFWAYFIEIFCCSSFSEKDKNNLSVSFSFRRHHWNEGKGKLEKYFGTLKVECFYSRDSMQKIMYGFIFKLRIVQVDVVLLSGWWKKYIY